MRPVLLHWHGIRIHSHPAFLYVGMVLGLIAGNYAANVSSLNSVRVFVATLLLIVVALVGARLLFVATHWQRYRREPSRIWRRPEGGAAMQGGLLLAVALSAPVLAAIGLPFGAFWDVATFTIVIGLIFARLGCLLHGCCGGRPTQGRLALCLPNQRGVWRRRIPTQLLEAGGGVLILLGAIALWDQRPFPGAVFLSAVTVYACGRFALEPLREHRDQLGRLDLQQALAAAFGTLALAGLLIAWLG